MKNFNDYKKVGVNENSKGNKNKMNHKKYGLFIMSAYTCWNDAI
ncbi:hypothetical protein SH2C18_13710 [Clostridium sediminicola]